MYRIVVFLLLIAAAAAGAAWVADQSGNVMLSWDGWRLETSLPVFALALGVALANLVGVIVGAGDEPAALGVAFAAVMLAAAAGLWARNYLAVLAFEALLAVGIIYAALSLLLASSLLGLLLGIGVIAVCSPIFWLLVRVMARLQVPAE